jgi:hypothetical protein
VALVAGPALEDKPTALPSRVLFDAGLGSRACDSSSSDFGISSFVGGGLFELVPGVAAQAAGGCVCCGSTLAPGETSAGDCFGGVSGCPGVSFGGVCGWACGSGCGWADTGCGGICGVCGCVCSGVMAGDIAGCFGICTTCADAESCAGGGCGGCCCCMLPGIVALAAGGCVCCGATSAGGETSAADCCGGV